MTSFWVGTMAPRGDVTVSVTHSSLCLLHCDTFFPSTTLLNFSCEQSPKAPWFCIQGPLWFTPLAFAVCRFSLSQYSHLPLSHTVTSATFLRQPGDPSPLTSYQETGRERTSIYGMCSAGQGLCHVPHIQKFSQSLQMSYEGSLGKLHDFPKFTELAGGGLRVWIHVPSTNFMLGLDPEEDNIPRVESEEGIPGERPCTVQGRGVWGLWEGGEFSLSEVSGGGGGAGLKPVKLRTCSWWLRSDFCAPWNFWGVVQELCEWVTYGAVVCGPPSLGPPGTAALAAESFFPKQEWCDLIGNVLNL